MDKVLFNKIFKNTILSKCIFQQVELIHRVLFKNQTRFYKWNELCNIPYELANYGYLEQIKNAFKKRRAKSFYTYQSSFLVIVNAIKVGNIDILRYIFEELSISLELVPGCGITYDPMYFAAKVGRMEVVEYLESIYSSKLRSTSFTWQWSYQYAMTIAPLSGSMEMLKHMVNRFNNGNQRFIPWDYRIDTPFDNAASMGRIDMIEYLAETRPDDRSQSSMYHHSAKSHQVETIRYLMKKDVDRTDILVKQPLESYAAIRDNPDILEFIQLKSNSK